MRNITLKFFCLVTFVFLILLFSFFVSADSYIARYTYSGDSGYNIRFSSLSNYKGQLYIGGYDTDPRYTGSIGAPFLGKFSNGVISSVSGLPSRNWKSHPKIWDLYNYTSKMIIDGSSFIYDGSTFSAMTNGDSFYEASDAESPRPVEYNGKLYLSVGNGYDELYVFDGNSWSPFLNYRNFCSSAGDPCGIFSYVNKVGAVGVYNNKLYVSLLINRFSSEFHDSIFLVYDGTSWSYSEGIDGDYVVEALESHGGKLYAAAYSHVTQKDETVFECDFQTSSVQTCSEVLDMRSILPAEELTDLQRVYSFAIKSVDGKLYLAAMLRKWNQANVFRDGVIYRYNGNSWDIFDFIDYGISGGTDQSADNMDIEYFNNKLYVVFREYLLEYSLGPICGNGKLEEGEECDDGDTDNGDICSNSCKINSNICTTQAIELMRDYCDEPVGGVSDTDVISYDSNVCNSANRGSFAGSCKPPYISLTHPSQTKPYEVTDSSGYVNFTFTITGIKSTPSGTIPADIMFILDRSGSMNNNNRITIAKKALNDTYIDIKNYDEQQTPGVNSFKVGFSSFNHDPQINAFLDYTTAETFNYKDAKACGCTGIGEGINTTIVKNFRDSRLSCNDGTVKKVIVVASDGAENRKSYLYEVKNDNRIPDDITFHVIGVASKTNWRSTLKDIAYNWGTKDGTYHQISSIEKLYDVYRNITQIYTSDDPASTLDVHMELANGFYYRQSNYAPYSVLSTKAGTNKIIDWSLPPLKEGESITVEVKLYYTDIRFGEYNVIDTTKSYARGNNKCGAETLNFNPIKMNYIPFDCKVDTRTCSDYNADKIHTQQCCIEDSNNDDNGDGNVNGGDDKCFYNEDPKSELEGRCGLVVDPPDGQPGECTYYTIEGRCNDEGFKLVINYTTWSGPGDRPPECPAGPITYRVLCGGGGGNGVVGTSLPSLELPFFGVVQLIWAAILIGLGYAAYMYLKTKPKKKRR